MQRRTLAVNPKAAQAVPKQVQSIRGLLRVSKRAVAHRATRRDVWLNWLLLACVGCLLQYSAFAKLILYICRIVAGSTILSDFQTAERYFSIFGKVLIFLAALAIAASIRQVVVLNSISKSSKQKRSSDKSVKLADSAGVNNTDTAFQRKESDGHSNFGRNSISASHTQISPQLKKMDGIFGSSRIQSTPEAAAEASPFIEKQAHAAKLAGYDRVSSPAVSFPSPVTKISSSSRLPRKRSSTDLNLRTPDSKSLARSANTRIATLSPSSLVTAGPSSSHHDSIGSPWTPGRTDLSGTPLNDSVHRLRKSVVMALGDLSRDLDSSMQQQASDSRLKSSWLEQASEVIAEAAQSLQPGFQISTGRKQARRWVFQNAVKPVVEIITKLEDAENESVVVSKLLDSATQPAQIFQLVSQVNALIIPIDQKRKQALSAGIQDSTKETNQIRSEIEGCMNKVYTIAQQVHHCVQQQQHTPIDLLTQFAALQQQTDALLRKLPLRGESTYKLLKQSLLALSSNARHVKASTSASSTDPAPTAEVEKLKNFLSEFDAGRLSAMNDSLSNAGDSSQKLKDMVDAFSAETAALKAKVSSTEIRSEALWTMASSLETKAQSMLSALVAIPDTQQPVCIPAEQERAQQQHLLQLIFDGAVNRKRLEDLHSRIDKLKSKFLNRLPVKLLGELPNENMLTYCRWRIKELGKPSDLLSNQPLAGLEWNHGWKSWMDQPANPVPLPTDTQLVLCLVAGTLDDIPDEQWQGWFSEGHTQLASPNKPFKAQHDLGTASLRRPLIVSSFQLSTTALDSAKGHAALHLILNEGSRECISIPSGPHSIFDCVMLLALHAKQSGGSMINGVHLRDLKGMHAVVA